MKNELLKIKACKRPNFQTLGLNYYYERNEKNFRLLYEAMNGPILGKINSILKNEDDSLEVLSEVFETIFTDIDSFKPDRGAFTTWVYTIARNKAFGFYNNKAKWNTPDYDISDMFDCLEIADEDMRNLIFLSSENEMTSIDKEGAMEMIAKKCMDILSTHKDSVVIDSTLLRLTTKKTLREIAEKHNTSISLISYKVDVGMKYINEMLKEQNASMYKLYKEAIRN